MPKGPLLILLVSVILTAAAIVWFAPVVGVRNSYCEQHPYSANCR